jgi:hypothetical protein
MAETSWGKKLSLNNNIMDTSIKTDGQEYIAKKEGELEYGDVVDYRFDERKLSTNKKGGAEVCVGENSITLSQDETCGIGVGNDSIILDGRLHIGKAPSQVRINGWWIFNEEILTGLPSGLFTPVPTLLYKDPPYAKKASKFAKLIKSFAI